MDGSHPALDLVGLNNGPVGGPGAHHDKQVGLGQGLVGAVVRRLGAKLQEDAAVCVDVGQNQIFTCKYLPQKHGRLLTSGGLGTTGYALPAGVGSSWISSLTEMQGTP